MIRRVHIPRLEAGRSELPIGEAHHVRDVLRLQRGDEVELFASDGATALARIEQIDSAGVFVTVDADDLKIAAPGGITITVASAVPKGDRADWMIEKLSELGVSKFIPLVTARSIVLPVGKNKRERWQRIAKESAKQSRRSGVMHIDELTELADAIASSASSSASRHFCSTEPDAAPLATALGEQKSIALFIGPEGGWTANEIKAMRAANMSGLKLTDTVLRIETAAIAAAAIVSVMTTSDSSPRVRGEGVNANAHR